MNESGALKPLMQDRTTIEASAPGRSRNAYQAPRLTSYGPLNTLTRGGSGNSQEIECTPPQPTPGCNPDPTKWRP